MKKTILILLAIIFINNFYGQEKKYKNSQLPVEERVDDLLSRMSLEEKFWQLFMIPGDLSDGKEKYKNGIFGFQVSTKGTSGNAAEQLLSYGKSGSAESVAEKINEIQKYFIEETELGIPIIVFDEALHGLVRDGATAFPQAIGLAATWNTDLMKEVAHAISQEVKSRGIRQILSPVINISRDVRWGRVEESYGEDPFLTTQMGVSFISEFEKMGVITTPKHFVANVGDGGRDSYPIHFNERLMEEIYFPAFKHSVQDAKALSLMISYNSYDGTPCTASDWLLNKKLKDEWGFEGFVISDAGAIGGANVLHFTTKDYAESTKEAVEGGLDVIFQTSYSHFPLFFEAFEKGMISEKAIDEAVRRVLRAKFNLGLFENPYVDPTLAKELNNNNEHRQLAKKAAQESIVLLKNKNEILPFGKKIKKLAVIGNDAAEGRLGGYSGPGNNIVSILDGIKNKLGNNTEISFTPGVGRESNEYKVIPGKNLFNLDNGNKNAGLLGKYYSNPKFSGDPTFTKIDKQINFRWTLFSPDPDKLDYDWYSVSWEGKIVGPKNGIVKIGIEGNDGYRLFIDNEMIIDNWTQKSYRTELAEYNFVEGKEYDIKVQFYTTAGNTYCKLVWDYDVENNWEEQINEAVTNVKNSDAAIIVAGIEEGEFRDRAFLSLPGHQEELINSISKIGKPTIVVLVGGSAITMNNWINNIDGIIDIWYPGEVGGDAVADVIFGDYNPAGRLPITFPIDESQLPLYYNHKPTGRGDDYINLTGQPLFPFGYGLSYTNFVYSNLRLSKKEISQTDNIQVELEVTNIGKIDGDEVIQLYIKDLFASVARPIIELKGFKRVHIKSGETKKVSFEITPEHLEMLDINLNRIVEPGDFRIMIGASSKDIRLRETITVK
ncbi:MAG: glycoside hydrolase family 3 C-terminal domain-containing protein [Ignavibacteriales bacterium]|nr:glycoside hydrolase family 3 C-terminal domain-containing protein [Ignavibacteriales bacterium]